MMLNIRSGTTWIVTRAILAMALAVTTFEFVPLAQDSAKASALITALLVLVAAGVSIPSIRRASLSTPVGLLLTLTLVPSLAFTLATTSGRATALVGGAGPTLLGWGVALWLFARPESGPGPDWSRWEPPRWALPVLLAVAFAVLALAHQLAVGRWAMISDEVIYLLQGKWFWDPAYGWSVPQDVRNNFLMRKLGVTPGGSLYGMYPPGWPAVLALFDAVGLRWWSSVILGTLSIAVTYRLGTLLYSRAAGLLAAAMLAVHPWFLVWHAGYMAHGLTILCILLAAYWLVESETRHGAGRAWRWLAVGACIALVVTTRSLTGVAMGTSLGLWMAIRRRLSPSDLVRCALTVLAGAAPLAAWFFHYNFVTNGLATRVSYQALHGNGYDLGFGDRGFTAFNESMERVRVNVEFTLRSAIENVARRAQSVNLTFLPYALLTPVALLAVHAGHKWRWSVLAAFLVLPALYFFYWGDDFRAYSELLPFVVIWSAAGCLAVARTRPRLAAGLVSAVFCGSVMLNIPGRWERLPANEPWVLSDYTGNPSRFSLFERLDRLQRERGRLLVFVDERGTLYDVLIDRLYFLNQAGFDSRILVARDRGPDNARLIARYGDRTPVVVSDSGRLKEAGIHLLPR